MKASLKIGISATAVALIAVVGVFYVLGQRSRRTQPVTEVAPTQGTKQVTLKAGDDLQAALKAARFGDTIILQAGATFKGPVTLMNKGAGTNTDADYITIRTSDLAGIPAEGQRVKPEHARAMPKIVSPNQQSAVSTDEQAHHFKFVGIEFTLAADANYVYNLIDLGRSDYKTESQFPHHLVFDRCYVHSTGLNKARRGIALNSAETSVLNSYVSGFAGDGDETQAVAGWNGPGPFHILNNYLEAGAEILMFGGADPSIANLVPSDIEIRRNHFYRQPSWQGKVTIKGNVELKNARRVVIDGNVINSPIRETAFVLTVRNQQGNAPWSTIEDVEITNNIVSHASTGINILGNDTYHPSQMAKRITISNNLFTDLVSPGDIAYFVQINGGDSVTIEHNTVEQAGNITSAYDKPTTAFVFRNNIVQYNQYGMACFIQGQTCSQNMACNCFARPLIKGNLIIDNAGVGANYALDQNFPLGNWFARSVADVGFTDAAQGNWRLSEKSKYRGRATDGKDPGVVFMAMEASGVTQVAEVGAKE